MCISIWRQDMRCPSEDSWDTYMWKKGSGSWWDSAHGREKICSYRDHDSWDNLAMKRGVGRYEECTRHSSNDWYAGWWDSSAWQREDASDCCQAVNFHHAQATPAHVAKNNRQCVRSFKVLTDRVVPYIDETIGSVADADHNARFATVVVLEGLSV